MSEAAMVAQLIIAILLSAPANKQAQRDALRELLQPPQDQQAAESSAASISSPSPANSVAHGSRSDTRVQTSVHAAVGSNGAGNSLTLASKTGVAQDNVSANGIGTDRASGSVQGEQANGAGSEPMKNLPAALADINPSFSFSQLGLPAAILAVLASIAFYLTKARPAHGRLLHIVETAPLGPKRALVVVKVGGKFFLLGSSETSISLLSELDDVQRGQEVASKTRTEVKPARFNLELPSDQASLLSRILGKKTKSKHASPRFDELLDESAEDQELRRKLQAGMAGRIS